MKILFIPLLLLNLAYKLSAQEFPLVIYFENPEGFRDTLYTGADARATLGYDAQFDGEDIVATPLKDGLDVRLGIGVRYGTFEGAPYASYKRNVVPYDVVPTVLIYSNSFPITARWNSADVADDAVDGTVFTSVHPGGWWDVGSPSDLYRVLLAERDSVTFTSNGPIDPDREKGSSFYRINDTVVSKYYLSFADELMVSTRDQLLPSSAVTVSPNPARESFRLAYTESCHDCTVSVLTADGRHVGDYPYGHTITTANWARGVYLAQLYEGARLRWVGKVMVATR